MIVKNESAVIRRCLDSVKGIIDYWVIVDTGSDDGTQAIIQECLQDIPGELHERSWVNFAHNRNEALALGKERGDYLLFIDADEWLVYRDALQLPELTEDFYAAAYHHGSSISQRVLFVNGRFDWKWDGVIHESIDCLFAHRGHFLEEAYIQATHDGFRSKDLQKKYLMDAQVMEEALQNDPQNTRYIYHLAGTYEAAKEYELALKYFDQRIAINDSNFEIYYSLYRLGIIQQHLGMPPEVFLKSFVKAYLFRPTRAEPFFSLANYYMGIKCHILGYLFSKSAISISDTNDFYYNQFKINEYGLYYQLAECAAAIGEFQEAYEALRHLLAVETLPPDIREASEKNIALPVFDPFRNQIYTEHASQIGFRRRRQPLSSSPPASPNLFKLGCFGASKPGSNSGRLLAQFPIFESRSV
ncbi:MAG: hypothetical protein HW387_848 [Parachlamydiales bacterium]|nr:hypothetical protein [Parachlamydiales bacterium]